MKLKETIKVFVMAPHQRAGQYGFLDVYEDDTGREKIKGIETADGFMWLVRGEEGEHFYAKPNDLKK